MHSLLNEFLDQEIDESVKSRSNTKQIILESWV